MIRRAALHYALLLMILSQHSTVFGQVEPKTVKLTVECSVGGKLVADKLQLIVCKKGNSPKGNSQIVEAALFDRIEFSGGKASVDIKCGKPAAIIVMGIDRTYVPVCLSSLAVHEGSPPALIPFNMSRDVNSTEGKLEIERASRIANNEALGSEIDKELKSWIAGEKQEKARAALSKSESEAVGVCLEMIRGCQLDDGAFNMRNEANSPGSPVWIRPYFGQYAALALLAENDRKKNPQDMKRVADWLQWCVENQTPQGFWFDCKGTRVNHPTNNEYDSWDSYAAMFLVVVERYQRCGCELSPELLFASKKAVQCIASVYDATDGLTWNLPDEKKKTKFLQDNIESYAGFVAAERIFSNTRSEEETRKTARMMADGIKAALPQYWQPDRQRFSVALHKDGNFQEEMLTLYPECTVQLFAIAFMAREPDTLWKEMNSKFSPEEGFAAAGGPERWLTAASRIGGDTEKEWRGKVVKSVASFRKDNVYIDRASIAALSLLEGAGWMPGLLEED